MFFACIIWHKLCLYTWILLILLKHNKKDMPAYGILPTLLLTSLLKFQYSSTKHVYEYSRRQFENSNF